MTRPTLLSVLVLGGCTASVTAGGGPDASGSSSSSGPTVVETSTGTTAGLDESTTATDPASSSTTVSAWETEGADEGYATTGNCGFTCPPPPGPGGGFGCNFSDQDCFEGEKCAPWANDGGVVWNALRCVPVADRPHVLGEDCTVEGSFVSGVDSCDVGLVCTVTGTDSLRSNAGTCTQLCNAGPCPDGTLCTVPGTLNVGACGEICDPLADGACPPGLGCLPAGLGFACHLAFNTGNDEPCTAVADCGLTHVCTQASQCGGEPGDTCCAQLCDLESPDCPTGQTCTDYGSPLAAYATVGFCEG
ncbi:MAG: hypothetical protein ACRBN8_38075 [Nannocystales bacterium]